MLDLNKLEKKLDVALAKETKETLTKWLNEKREREEISYLGDGKFMDEIESIYEQFELNKKGKQLEVNDEMENASAGEYHYGEAA